MSFTGSGYPSGAAATGSITRAMLASTSAAAILGATAAGAVADLTPAQAKTVLAIAAADVSGLGAFATATDAANLTGTIAAARMPAHTGDVTSSVGTIGLTIANSVVTYAKIQNVAASRLLGNPTGGATAPSEISLAGGLAFSGTTLTAAGALTPTSVASTGLVTSSGATSGIGYATGAGGTVTQATSKATGATLNKACGEITLNAAALAASTTVSFVFTNSAIAAGDMLVLLHVTTGTFGSYSLNAHGFGAGSCTIDVRNISLGSLSEAIVIRFAVIKAVTA